MSNQIIIEKLWTASDINLIKNNYDHNQSTALLKYLVSGVQNEQEAISVVYASAPEGIGNEDESIPKRGASIDERINDDTWSVSVSYSHGPSYDLTNDEEIESGKDLPEVCFQCDSVTTHVVKAIDQTCVYKNPYAPIINNEKEVPIGWNGLTGTYMQAEGVDIQQAETREQYTRILSYEKVRSSAYRRNIAKLVGCVNSSEFKGWNSGEAMFMGMSYTTPQRGVENVKVVFDFLIRPNEYDVKIMGVDIGTVRGHDYVWAVTSSAQGNGITPFAMYIFKSKVSKYADFSKLGL